MGKLNEDFDHVWGTSEAGGDMGGRGRYGRQGEIWETGLGLERMWKRLKKNKIYCGSAKV